MKRRGEESRRMEREKKKKDRDGEGSQRSPGEVEEGGPRIGENEWERGDREDSRGGGVGVEGG